MSVARFTFGPRLKAHRERKGITLQDIADETKIGLSLLSALERNDVTQWPKGIFRRSFLLSYARAIDIPFEPTWTEFVQLFPEDGARSVAHPVHQSPLRLTLAPKQLRLITPSRRNATAATLDFSIVVTVGLLVALPLGLSIAATLAVASLIYGAAATTLVGGSFSRWYLRTRSSTRKVRVTSNDDSVIDVEEPASDRTPRIFSIANPHTTSPGESRERRVADR